MTKPRVTAAELKARVKECNRYCVLKGSPFFLVHGERNGFHALDVFRADPDGRVHCYTNHCLGTKGECYGHTWDFYWKADGKLTRQQCARLAGLNGVSLAGDFHALDSEKREVLQALLKFSKYRAPKYRSGSPLLCFFYSLAKIKLGEAHS